MALLGKAMLGVWNEVPPEQEADFNGWYVHEHIPERTEVPGMDRGRRYRAVEGSPRYMALYEARTMAVLTSGAYRTQLANPTEWTRRVTSKFSFMQRGICEVIADAGQGVGGYATVLHFNPIDSIAAQAWVNANVIALTQRDQIVAAHAWVAADNEPASPTSELSRAAAADQRLNWVLMIEAGDRNSLQAARDALLASNPPVALTAYPLYQLLYVLQRT